MYFKGLRGIGLYIETIYIHTCIPLKLKKMMMHAPVDLSLLKGNTVHRYQSCNSFENNLK